MFQFPRATHWQPGRFPGYKYTDAAKSYPPCQPFPGLGRFGDGSHKTLYIAESAEGAVAEFLRRHPELIDFQIDLRIRIWQLDLDIAGLCIDTRETPGQVAIGIPLDRLVSSEADETIRYGACRELARVAHSEGFIGIAYPSAAFTGSTWNLVLFGDQAPDLWTCDQHGEIDRPILDAVDINIIA